MSTEEQSESTATPTGKDKSGVKQHERLIGIQAGRGLAALLVVLYHASRMISLPQYAGRVAFGGGLQFGHAGVDFFFVLSGFIIYFVHNRDIGKPDRLLRYGWRRMTRIYPTYWLISAAAIFLLLAKHQPVSLLHLLKSEFLFPDTTDPYLSVAWTLIHEMFFYALFALVIVRLELGLGAAILLAAAATWHPAVESPVLRLLTSYRNLEFVPGIAAAYAVLHTRLPRPLLIAALGAGLFLATGVCENIGILNWDDGLSGTLFSAASAIMILGIATAERHGELSIGRVGEFFGGQSYALYLLHVIVVGLSFRMFAAIGAFRWAPAELFVLIATAISVAMASGVYTFFELPMQKYLRHAFN